MSQNNQIVLVHLKESYRENRYNNYVRYNSVEESFNEVNDTTTCTLEVLCNINRKMYFDIEKIPRNNERLIFNIIRDICLFINNEVELYGNKTFEEYKLLYTDQTIDPNSYLLTKNIASVQHEGLSYHLVFPYVISATDNKKLVGMFTTMFNQYQNYIDPSVYGQLRLFRLPDNGKVTGEGIDNNDKHIILKGSLKELYIQDIQNCKQLNVNSIINWNSYVEVEVKQPVAKRKRSNNGGPSNGLNVDEMTDALLTKFNELNSKMDSQQKLIDLLYSKLLSIESKI